MIMIKNTFNVLLKELGPQGWWPVNGKYNKNKFNIPRNKQEKFEIVVGAVLTQNTSWKNAEYALKNLRIKKLISPEKILKTPDKKLSELIRPAGYFNQKAKYLKNISKFLVGNKNLEKLPAEKIREMLLSVKGIGPETADSIMLYAFKKPFFVIDLYTKRIFSRAGICSKKIKYNDLQEKFHSALPRKTSLFNEYHALLVELAKKHCSRIPSCKNCPVSKKCKKSL